LIYFATQICKLTMANIRRIISFDKLDTEVLNAVNEKYPNGWRNHVKKIDKGDGSFFHAITIDYGDFSYLVKVNVKIDTLSDLEKEEKKLNFEEAPEKEVEVEFNDEENYED